MSRKFSILIILSAFTISEIFLIVVISKPDAILLIADCSDSSPYLQCINLTHVLRNSFIIELKLLPLFISSFNSLRAELRSFDWT